VLVVCGDELLLRFASGDALPGGRSRATTFRGVGSIPDSGLAVFGNILSAFISFVRLRRVALEAMLLIAECATRSASRWVHFLRVTNSRTSLSKISFIQIPPLL